MQFVRQSFDLNGKSPHCALIAGDVTARSKHKRHSKGTLHIASIKRVSRISYEYMVPHNSELSFLDKRHCRSFDRVVKAMHERLGIIAGEGNRCTITDRIYGIDSLRRVVYL